VTPCDAIAVVIVDDDASFRSGLAANLADDGHVVFQYDHPRVVPRERLAATHVLLADYDMGDVDGMTFADRVHRARPEVAIILITAYWTAEVEAAAASRPFLHLCRKPVDYEVLHDRVHELAVRL
jgi:DNA-binding NtrC family response regulator